ncbi:MAG TPA: DNA-3-methyladenine glycosylase 2 family protein [Candidatus Eisenbacteria bacterium]|nr:DNA-3-methyladenine glycosylase 2 family protein [Candidatus Eisenbacteria bacterium]
MSLQYDPQAAALALAEADPPLGRIIEQVGDCTIRLKRASTPFASLVESITYQQITGHAASRILGRVVALYRPRRFPRPEDLLATPDDALRAAGLSRTKVASMKDLAAKCLDGTVPPLRSLRRLEDAEIVERLTAVRGVGPWTVEMLLIFRLGRPDIMPATDYGVRMGYQSAFRTRALPTPAQIVKRAERWRPYRSVAAWYLWRAVDLKRKAAGAKPGAGRA